MGRLAQTARERKDMNPILIHIYGPLSIHIYGLCIAIGGLISFFMLSRDKKMQNLASEQTMITILQVILISGFLGGRILEMASQPEPMNDSLFLFKFWKPGLSVLGAILSAASTLTIYLYYKNIPLLSLLDRISLYTPLAQSFGRLGCFLAGCCYGLPTTSRFSIIYTHPNNLAPLNCALQPSQLYSASLLLIIFLCLYFIIQNYTKKPGQLLFSYLFAIGIERFVVDFTRGDKIFMKQLPIFSFHQWIALAICCLALLSIFFISKRRK